ncbi:MAG: putative hydrolase of the superfamily [Actinomycetota bacterium]|nr:putative hydrolase of the superfamily [Actinomycetota bacterium]
MPAPKAVLLDVGGIFHLPDHDRIRAAFGRAEVDVNVDTLDRAHYAGAARFTVEDDEQIDWKARWQRYLDAYITECGVAETGPTRDEVHIHLDSEFAVGDLWSRIIPGSVDGLRALVATGVHVGVISNADGTVAQRLAAQEVLQVGPGLGVEVACVIDSGAVGVSKPDPRIFQIALDAIGVAPADAWYVGDMPGIDVVGARAAGLWPIVMDPFDFQAGVDYERVTALAQVAEMVSAS